MLSLVFFAAFICIAHSVDYAISSSSQEGRQLLNDHNAARRAVGQRSLSWDSGLARSSYNWGRRLNCVLRHTSIANRAKAASVPGKTYRMPTVTWKNYAYNYYGENLASSYPITSAKAAAVKANAGWVTKEKAVYTLRTNQCRGVCGHYTQIIWKETTKVGCSYHTCSSNKQMIVCQYWPAGNFGGVNPVSGTRTGYSDVQFFGIDFKSNTTLLLLGATVLNTLLIIAMIIYKNRSNASMGYSKQLAQTDYDTEEEALNQVV